MKSTDVMSAIPIAFSWSITPDKLHRKISGTVTSYSSLYVSFVYILKHFPGASLPALPLLYVAEFLLMLVTINESIPVVFRYALCFTRPQSTTNLTPWIVTEVSAMLVARIIFR
jgi:hypothetical protein